MKETIILGNKEFKTKKELTEYIQSLFKKHGRGLVIRGGHEYFEFFHDLLLRHPDYAYKTSMGVGGFRFGSNDLHNFVELQILAHDSYVFDEKELPYEPFGWRDAVKGSVRKENKLAEAMRLAVVGQIHHFRNLNKYPDACPICSKPSEFYHVDHRIKFRELMADFLSDYSAPTEFVKNEVFQWEFREEDIEFNSKWQDFHAETAELWYVCPTCNIKDKHNGK